MIPEVWLFPAYHSRSSSLPLDPGICRATRQASSQSGRRLAQYETPEQTQDTSEEAWGAAHTLLSPARDCSPLAKILHTTAMTRAADDRALPAARAWTL
jgi:hypothetical protein